MRSRAKHRLLTSGRAAPASELERVDGGQLQDLRELVERAPRFVEERWVAKVRGREAIAIVLANPALEVGRKRVIEKHARRDRVAFRGGERDGKPQARRAAAVAHALPQIE